MGMEQYSYSKGDANWYATFLARVEKQSKGFIGLSLTNYATSTVCAIASGSALEINGAVFIASATVSVSGSIASGLNYIIFSVTGTTAEPYWTTTVCSWDTAKQGYYTGSPVFERCIGGIDSVAGSTYDKKWVYDRQEQRNYPATVTFSGSIIDKYGNEVIAMQVETMTTTVNTSIASAGTGVVNITGYSWTPDAVLGVQIKYGTADSLAEFMLSYPAPREWVSGHNFWITGITFSANTVSIAVENQGSGGTGIKYIEHAICTASKTS